MTQKPALDMKRQQAIPGVSSKKELSCTLDEGRANLVSLVTFTITYLLKSNAVVAIRYDSM